MQKSASCRAGERSFLWCSSAEILIRLGAELSWWKLFSLVPVRIFPLFAFSLRSKKFTRSSTMAYSITAWAVYSFRGLFSSICCLLIQHTKNFPGQTRGGGLIARTFFLLQYSWAFCCRRREGEPSWGEKLWGRNSHFTNFSSWIFHEPF